MKTNIATIYPHFDIREHASDLYVADYTKQTNSERGVVIASTPPDDIHSFPIQNPNSVNVCTVIFDGKSFIEGDDSLSQCECMAFANTSTTNHPWVLLLELKYCQWNNRKSNITKATKQVEKTLGYLKAANAISEKQRCYLIVSLPDPNNQPYDGWGKTPDEKMALKKQNIFFKATDKIVIENERIIAYD